MHSSTFRIAAAVIALGFLAAGCASGPDIRADYDKAARYLDQEQSYTPAPRRKPTSGARPRRRLHPLPPTRGAKRKRPRREPLRRRAHRRHGRQVRNTYHNKP